MLSFGVPPLLWGLWCNIGCQMPGLWDTGYVWFLLTSGRCSVVARLAAKDSALQPSHFPASFPPFPSFCFLRPGFFYMAQSGSWFLNSCLSFMSSGTADIPGSSSLVLCSVLGPGEVTEAPFSSLRRVRESREFSTEGLALLQPASCGMQPLQSGFVTTCMYHLHYLFCSGVSLGELKADLVTAPHSPRHLITPASLPSSNGATQPICVLRPGSVGAGETVRLTRVFSSGGEQRGGAWLAR